MLTGKYTIKSVLESQKNTVKHLPIQNQRTQKEFLNDLENPHTCILVLLKQLIHVSQNIRHSGLTGGKGVELCVQVVRAHRPEKLAALYCPFLKMSF